MEQVQLFQPIGEKAKWWQLYDAVKNDQMGTLYTFRKLGEISNLDIKERERSAVYRTNKELLKTHKKMLISVRNIGYKIAEPTAQMNHAKQRKTKGTKQFKYSVYEALNMDTSNLTQTEKSERHAFITHMQGALALVRARQKESLALSDKAKKTAESSLKKYSHAQQEQRQAMADLDGILEQVAALKRKLEN